MVCNLCCSPWSQWRISSLHFSKRTATHVGVISILREYKLNFAHCWWVPPGSRRPQGYSVFQILNWGLINVTNTSIVITKFPQGAREAFKIDLGPELLFQVGNWPKERFHAFRLILCSNWLVNSLPNEHAVPTENLNNETKAQIELHLIVEKWNWTDIWRWNKSNTVLYLGPHLNFGETCILSFVCENCAYHHHNWLS